MRIGVCGRVRRAGSRVGVVNGEFCWLADSSVASVLRGSDCVSEVSWGGIGGVFRALVERTLSMSSRDKTIMRCRVGVSDCCRVREKENVSVHERWTCNDEGNGGKGLTDHFFFFFF